MKCPRCQSEFNVTSHVPTACMVCNYPLTSGDDVVNNPSHYTQGKYETIDVILDIVEHLPGQEGYLVGSIIKYLSRYHFKNGEEDLKKARWFADKLVEVVADEA